MEIVEWYTKFMMNELTDRLSTYGIIPQQKNFFEEAVYIVALIYNVLDFKINAYLKPYKLNAAQFNTLVAIRHHGKERGLSQIEIGKHLIITPSNMTKLLDKLERSRLITRSPSRSDRRINMIHITGKAEQLLDDIWPVYQKEIKSLMGSISKKDQKQMTESLKRWLGELTGDSHAG